MRKINGASKRGRKKQQGLSNDNFVGGNNKGLSIGPILYQARRILPQMLTKTMWPSP